MKQILLILPIALMPLFGLTQWPEQVSPTDSNVVRASSYFREAEQAAAGQRIWSLPLYGPTLLVNLDTRMAYSNHPDSLNILRPVNGIYAGTLPASLVLANTAIDWLGTRWSVLLWPLPPDREDRLNLFLHESFHRIQTALGLPERSPTDDHLSKMQGRILFLLELNALKAAQARPLNQRSQHLAAALIFRRQRQKIYPEGFPNERILEMSEGLAEYTGVILARGHDRLPAYLARQIDSAAARPSLIRSAAYFTGPAYGYLLYQRDQQWTNRIDSNAAFETLITQYYQLQLSDSSDDRQLTALAKRYNGDAIRASEQIRENKRLREFDHYQQLFTRHPVLTIPLQNMNISFNPNTLFDLDTLGTVFPTAEIQDSWGRVQVLSGGMLMKDWSVITLPASTDLRATDRVINGTGWTITLHEGWQLKKTGQDHYELFQQ